jgi:hypothetical protein
MDISDAADLLAIARETLLGELVPALPNERRYAALMVANAMAIAARGHRLAPGAERDEAEALRRLLRDIDPPPVVVVDVDATAGALPALRCALRDAIRAGAFDPPQRESALAAALLQIATDQVAIANPKALHDRR